MKLFELLQNLKLDQKIMIVESDSGVIHETTVGSAFSIFDLEGFFNIYIDGDIKIEINKHNESVIIVNVFNMADYHI